MFVVRAFKTASTWRARACASLRDVDAPIVGAVLNAVNLDHHEYSYYHYYYYKRDGYQPLTTQDPDDSSGPRAAAPPN